MGRILIEGIQGDSRKSVDAIGEIAKVIERISGYATTIAAAVEQQAATTRSTEAANHRRRRRHRAH